MFDNKTLKTGKSALIIISLMLLVFTLIPGVAYGDEEEQPCNHDYQVKSYANGLATLKCTECGDEQTGRVPTSFSAYWKLKSSDSYSSCTSLEAGLSDTVMFIISGITYSAESDQTFNQFVVESDSTKNCIIDNSSNSVTFNKTGKYTVSIYPKYNQNFVRTCVITVTEERPADESPAVVPVSEHKLSNGATVSITSLGAKTVSYDKAGSGKSVIVPDYVTINGTRYTVTVIAGNAFKGSKAKTVSLGKKVKTIKPYAFRSSAVKTLNIKTTKLTKKSVKKSLKKSKVSTLKIKVGTKKKNKKYIKKYKKIFTKANAGKKPKIK